VPLSPRLPVVVTVHDVAWLRVQAHAPAYARYYFGAFSVDRYRNVSQIAVDSKFSRSELLWVLDGYDPRRVHVVYPGVAEDFCTVERRRGDGRTILCVGTVERRKNLDAIVRVLPNLENARLVAVGPPTPYQDECRALAAQLGVSERIQFRGYVDRAELLELYATCGVVAVPSRYEGFGYAAAQALCAGTPCVVSDRASLPEVVGNDAPVVAVDDFTGWTESLAIALHGHRDASAAAARQNAIARFAWAASAKKMSDVYKAATS
jgi:alpha-1,3-rhamnosyl/mannosyltransferase